MSFWSMLGKIGAGVAAPFTGGASLAAIPAIDGLGKALSSGSQAAAGNRGAMMEALLAQDQMRLAGRQDDRSRESDAWKKMLHAGYVKNVQPQGPMFSPYAKPVAMPSDEARSSAGLLEAEMMKRLQPGGGFQPSDLSKYMKPSGWEKWGGILGAGLTGLSTLRSEDEEQE